MQSRGINKFKLGIVLIRPHASSENKFEPIRCLLSFILFFDSSLCAPKPVYAYKISLSDIVALSQKSRIYRLSTLSTNLCGEVHARS